MSKRGRRGKGKKTIWFDGETEETSRNKVVRHRFGVLIHYNRYHHRYRWKYTQQRIGIPVYITVQQWVERAPIKTGQTTAGVSGPARSEHRYKSCPHMHSRGRKQLQPLTIKLKETKTELRTQYEGVPNSARY